MARMKKAMGGYSMMKAKSGKKFPDLTGDGKVTRADILKGRGVIKNGGKVKKATGGKKMKNGGTVSMQLGSYGRQFGKNYSGKGGGAKGMKKCKMGC